MASNPLTQEGYGPLWLLFTPCLAGLLRTRTTVPVLVDGMDAYTGGSELPDNV